MCAKKSRGNEQKRDSDSVLKAFQTCRLRTDVVNEKTHRRSRRNLGQTSERTKVRNKKIKQKIRRRLKNPSEKQKEMKRMNVVISLFC